MVAEYVTEASQNEMADHLPDLIYLGQLPAQFGCEMFIVHRCHDMRSNEGQLDHFGKRRREVGFLADDPSVRGMPNPILLVHSKI